MCAPTIEDKYLCYSETAKQSSHCIKDASQKYDSALTDVNAINRLEEMFIFVGGGGVSR